jgi:C_GCAxxG_C_C family probable redox protein
VLLAVARHERIESNLLPRIATGLCSGIARTGGMCGAVSGGILAIGLVLGRSSPEQPVDPCYAAVKEFMQRFSGQFGSLSCPELTGVQLGTPEGQAAFREKGMEKECASFVASAAGMVIEICADRRKE